LSQTSFLTYADISSTIRTSVHADPSEKYLSYYVDNAARLYIALSYSAARFQNSTRDGPSESLYYLQKSITAVNDDIADPLKQASDSTIATVASMANIEVRYLTSSRNTARVAGLMASELEWGSKNCSRPSQWLEAYG
jgi:hypothetical protein